MNDSTTAVPTAIEHERSATAGAKSAARSRGRFRKGRSGNPRGRPKGSRNIATVVKNILAEKVTVRAGGSVQRVTKAQAFTLTMLNDAIKGKPQATEQVLMLAERAGRLSSLNPECQRGVLVVPGVSKSREDWERDHGADARGEKIFNREGRPIVTLAFTPEQGRELLNAGRLDEALACYHHVLANYAAIRDRRQPSADDDLDGRTP